MQKQTIVSVVFGVFILTFTIGFYAYAVFSPPTAFPPLDNVDPPLNSGAIGQTKIGGLWLATGGVINGLIVSNGNVGIGVSSPSYKLEVHNTANADGFYFYSGNVLTGEKDVFIIKDADSGGGGQDESSSLKVWRSGSFSPADDGSSVVDITYSGGAVDDDEQFYMLGRLVNEGAVEWGISLSDADIWTTGGIKAGATGVNCKDTNAPCFNNPTFVFDASSGNVGIGTASPQAALDVDSTTGGFIVPRMTTVQRDALTPVNGMIIYNTSTNQFNFYENGLWSTK